MCVVALHRRFNQLPPANTRGAVCCDVFRIKLFQDQTMQRRFDILEVRLPRQIVPLSRVRLMSFDDQIG